MTVASACAAFDALPSDIVVTGCLAVLLVVAAIDRAVAWKWSV